MSAPAPGAPSTFVRGRGRGRGRSQVASAQTPAPGPSAPSAAAPAAAAAASGWRTLAAASTPTPTAAADPTPNPTSAPTPTPTAAPVPADDADTCLICLCDLEAAQAVWSCRECSCLYHLPCIQDWVAQGVVPATPLSDELFPQRAKQWHCPKCRAEYGEAETPRVYLCFCGKEQDPVFDPWLAPHTCGAKCEKELPRCEHTCLSLCHAGRCPPCPVTVQATCFCGHTTAPKRCINRAFSCGQPCNRPLACGSHRCTELCHDGPCAPCAQTSRQQCACGRIAEQRPCDAPPLSCGAVCGRKLGCGHHTCAIVCHAGPCPPCPRAGPRSCPCGKVPLAADLPCTVEAEPCGQTCGKALPSCSHRCPQMCHPGPCGECRLVVLKTCRCGAAQKELPCGQDFVCDRRCKNMRACGRHACRQRCCDGTACPPCSELCGRRLGCKNHSCAAPCHSGPCYPCAITSDIACRCGATVKTVPCGAARQAQPPTCQQPCLLPSGCRHPQQAPHKCHFGPCPPCTQPCGQPIPGDCGHVCRAPCHDKPVKKKDKKPKTKTAAKKEQQQQQQQQQQAAAVAAASASPTTPDAASAIPPAPEYCVTPCPPCAEPVLRTCEGGHAPVEMACSKPRTFFCSQPCRRPLPCQLHVHQHACHAPFPPPASSSARLAPLGWAELDRLAASAPDEYHSQRQPCGRCEAVCSQPRPAGCEHSCAGGLCHGTTPCPPCEAVTAKPCHCGALRIHLTCAELQTLAPAAMAERLICGARCPEKLPCGHRCPLKCHPSGRCAKQTACKKRLTIRCGCGLEKAELVCGEQASAADRERTLPCSQRCAAARAEEAAAAKAAEEAAAAREREAEEQRRRELGGAPPPPGKRKRSRRRDPAEQEAEAAAAAAAKQRQVMQLNILIAVLVVVVAALAFYLISRR